MPLQLKRAYEPADDADGVRYLVDRLWPRGVRKEQLQLDGWLKQLAPTTELRRWFAHEPERWPEFQSRYRAELLAPAQQAMLRRLAAESSAGAVTLVFAAKDVVRNEAVVLKQLIEELSETGS